MRKLFAKENLWVGVLIFAWTAIFLLLGFYISDPALAYRMDRQFLYGIDDTFRYCLIKDYIDQPLILLHSYLKPFYALISMLFLKLLGSHIFTLRWMNALASGGILFLLYRLSRCLGFERLISLSLISIAASIPAYFLISISTLSEMLFCLIMMGAIYSYYAGYLIPSVLLISLMPVTRQEGIFFLLIWIVVLISRRRFSYIPLLFLPLISWLALAVIFLKSSVPNTFWYVTKILEEFHGMPSIYVLLLLWGPLVLVFGAWGLILSFGDGKSRKKFGLIHACFILPLAVMLVADLVMKRIYQTYPGLMARFLVPYTPLLVLYLGLALNYFRQRCHKSVLVIFVILLCLLNIFGLMGLRSVAVDGETGFSERDIVEFQKAERGLQTLLKDLDIKDVYIRAEESTRKFQRWIWMNLPHQYNLAFVVKLEGLYYTVFDLLRFRLNPEIELKEGIIVSSASDDAPALTQLLELPEIPARYYLIQAVDPKSEYKWPVKYMTGSLFAQREVESNLELAAAVELLSVARDELDEESLEKAESALNSLKLNYPDNYLVWYYLARAYLLRMEASLLSGNEETAREWRDRGCRTFEHSLLLNYWFPESWTYLALWRNTPDRDIMDKNFFSWFKMQRDIDYAKTMMGPLNPIVELHQGICYLLSPGILGGDRDQARRNFERAVDLSPAFLDGYIWLSLCSELDQNPALALIYYNKACSLCPGNENIADRRRDCINIILRKQDQTKL